MLAPATSPTRVRLVTAATPQEVYVGAPSCDPLLQYELLKALSNLSSDLYEQASRECGLTLDQARTLVKRGELVSATRAMRLARLIAQQSQSHEIFTEAGQSLFTTLYHRLPFSLRLTIRALPRSLRTRLALVATRYMAHSFAGGSGNVTVHRQRGRLYVSVADGVFSDRLETITGAYDFYRAVFEAMCQQLARAKYKVVTVKRARVRLNHCCFEIARNA